MSKSKSGKISKVIIAALVVVSAGGYVWQVNSLSTAGYNLKELQHEVDTLQSQNNDLQNKVVSLRSMDKLQNEISQLAMTSNTKVEYINPANKEIAQK